jgi:hypothetical protein
MARERIRMTNIMCGIMNHVDMRKADDADNEQAEPHRKDGLEDHAQVFSNDRKISGMAHAKLLRPLS